MTEFDRGFYTCRAENGTEMENEKKYHEKSISIYVISKIFRFNIIIPFIIKDKLNLKYETGKILMFLKVKIFSSLQFICDFKEVFN